MRRAIGPAMPIATALLPVASHMTHPIPAPPLAAKSAIAAERPKCLVFGFCSIVFVLSMRVATPNDPKLSDGGAWRGSCEGGAQKEATDV